MERIPLSRDVARFPRRLRDSLAWDSPVGNKIDHTSPIRYEGTGSVPIEGIFRTLESWDMRCDHENGVKLHLMDCRTTKAVVTKFLPLGYRDRERSIFQLPSTFANPILSRRCLPFFVWTM